MQVQIPEGIKPGMQFQIQVGEQTMAIACPEGAGPGSMIQIQVPAAQAPMAMPVAQPAMAMAQPVGGQQVTPQGGMAMAQPMVQPMVRTGRSAKAPARARERGWGGAVTGDASGRFRALY